MKKNILILFLVALVACDYPIFDSRKAAEPKVAVTSFFCPDSVMRVKVAPVTDAFSDSSVSLEVNEVKLTNLKTGQVVYFEKEDGSGSVYTTRQFLPKPGDVLKIEALTDASDDPSVAIDSIGILPAKFSITNFGVEINPNGAGDAATIKRTGTIEIDNRTLKSTSFYELLFFASIYSEIENKYREQIQLNLSTSTSFIVSEDYYPSKISIEAKPPQSLIFRGSNVPEQINIDFIYSSGMLGLIKGEISPAHFLRIEIREVSYAYYLYKTALYKQKNAIRGDIIYGAAPPVMVPSNVENGTGIFAGYNVTAIDTFIEEYAYQRK